MGRHQYITRKKARSRRVLWFFVFPLLLVLGIASTYGYQLYKKAEDVLGDAFDGEHGQSSLRDKKVNPKIDNVSILLIGVDGGDNRGTKNLRSDALMVATLNEKEKSVKLMSIPRDAYVYIPEVGYSTKINHAHSFGGPRGAIDTVENLLDIPIDYYVSLNFDAFMGVVDALDGIEVDVPYTFTEQDSEDKAGAITLEEGLQHLNGEEALALARTRKKDTDYMRGERQQEIIKAIVKKATSASSVLKYGSVIEEIGSNMRTSMTFDEMKSFIDYGLSGNLTLDTFSLKGGDMYLPNSAGQNIYYYEIDEEHLAEVKSTFQNHLGITVNTEPETDQSIDTEQSDETVDSNLDEDEDDSSLETYRPNQY